MMKIFTCNLPFGTSAPELRTLFSKYGPVKYVKIHVERETNQPRGRALITMRFAEDAERAIHELRGSTFGGRQLICCIHRKSFAKGEQDNYEQIDIA